MSTSCMGRFWGSEGSEGVFVMSSSRLGDATSSMDIAR